MKYLSIRAQLITANRKIEQLKGELTESKEISGIVLAKMLEYGIVDTNTAISHFSALPSWSSDTVFSSGETATYENGIYRCRQAHMSCENKRPDKEPSLWSKLASRTENESESEST